MVTYCLLPLRATVDIYSFEQEVSSLSSYLLPTHKIKSYSPYWFTILHMLIEEILSPIKFVTKWISISLSNASLLLFFNISSELSTVIETLRFPHSSWMNTILSKSSKFPMSSISSITSSYSSWLSKFFEGLSSSTKTWFSLKIKLEKWKGNICERRPLDVISCIFVSLEFRSVDK